MTAADFQAVLPEVVVAALRGAGSSGGRLTGQGQDGAGDPVVDRPAVLTVVALWIGFGGEGTRIAFGGMFRRRRLLALLESRHPAVAPPPFS